MGSVSSSMQQVVRGINAATEARAASERARVASERARVDTAGRDAEQRRVAVSELRSNTHNLVSRFHMEHQSMAKALKAKLSSEDKARIEAARQMMNSIRRAVNGIRSATKSMLGEFAADMRGAREAWAGVKKK